VSPAPVPVVAVSDAGDPRLSEFTRLTDVAARQAREPAEGLFIAEGEPVVRRALQAGFRARALLVADRYAGRAQELLETATARRESDDERDQPAAVVYAGTAELLWAVTGFHVHRGILGSFDRRPVPGPARLLAGARRVLAVEDSNSPTNLGAIFRCAAGLGMDALLLSPACADPLYRRCLRVSMGAVFSLPYARCTDWPADLLAPGFRILALTPAASARRISELTPTRDQRLIVVVGAEWPGLTPGALAVADELVRIPMSAGTDSLNVAAATAIACYAFGPARFQV
jgi:tRNA G18 (ribose-2'-O)-methylase SpoU